MSKNEFLNKISVIDFIEWFKVRLDQSGSFEHQYTIIKPKHFFSCDSLYSAHENYIWKKKVFDQTEDILNDISRNLRKAITDGDEVKAKKESFRILQWGGVFPKNSNRVESYGNNLTNYYTKVIELLNPDEVSLKNPFDGIVSNSGFTKIYSLIIDDFVIYDSRVAAALGMLVFMFCKDTGKTSIPVELQFAHGGGRKNPNLISDRRDPSSGAFKFPPINNSPTTHIINNIKANWLLKKVIEESNSNFVSLRQLEAALFMIGYDVQCSKYYAAQS